MLADAVRLDEWLDGVLLRVVRLGDGLMDGEGGARVGFGSGCGME